ncbi:hypothetical protein PENTCL1PPCAC_14382, partial [Pristionchus entomophagus]
SQVGLAYDIISLFTYLLFRTIPGCGWFADHFTATPLPAQMAMFFSYFARICQGLSNFFVCLNRATAILLPISHNRIWCIRWLLPLCFLGQFAFGAFVGWQAGSFPMHWLRYPQGQLYA